MHIIIMHFGREARRFGEEVGRFGGESSLPHPPIDETLTIAAFVLFILVAGPGREPGLKATASDGQNFESAMGGGYSKGAVGARAIGL